MILLLYFKDDPVVYLVERRSLVRKEVLGSIGFNSLRQHREFYSVEMVFSYLSLLYQTGVCYPCVQAKFTVVVPNDRLTSCPESSEYHI